MSTLPISTEIRILSEPLQLEDCLDFIRSDDCGAECYFVGTVRNKTKSKAVLKLDFEAYEPMAIKEMQKIAIQAMEKWPLHKVVIHHRVGVLEIGDVPVIIAVSSPHRKEAFAACQFCIDTLKETVPIWKKEIFEDGEVWVAAHP